MSLLDIILLAVALAMDCLTVSIVSGVIEVKSEEVKSEKWWIIRMAVLFGVFQAMMPLIGWLGISHFQAYMEAYDHWIAFAMLGFIGGRMVWESFDSEEEQHFNPRKLRTQLLLAIATSIDALAVGISFACLQDITLQPVLTAACIIGLCSTLFSVAGLCIGIKASKHINIRSEILGGIILISIGIKLLIEHLK